MKYVGLYEVVGEVLPSELVLRNRMGLCELWKLADEDSPFNAERLTIAGKVFYRQRFATASEEWFAKL